MLDPETLPDDGLVDSLHEHLRTGTNPGTTQSVQPHVYKWDDGEGGAIVALFAFHPDGQSINLPVDKLDLNPAETWSVKNLGPGPNLAVEDGALKAQLDGHQSVIAHLIPSK